jgi:hypothetical protein
MAGERRKLLQEYLLACVRDSALSWADLAKPDKILRVLSGDFKVVLRQIGKDSAVGLLQLGAVKLAEVAEKAMRK